jgi:hypothetical protein
MKQNENFREILEDNKKKVFIGMVSILFIGCLYVIYNRFYRDQAQNELLIKMDVVKDKIPNGSNGMGISPIEFMKMYEDVENLEENDTLELQKLNDKLDKIIKNEN